MGRYALATVSYCASIKIVVRRIPNDTAAEVSEHAKHVLPSSDSSCVSGKSPRALPRASHGVQFVRHVNKLTTPSFSFRRATFALHLALQKRACVLPRRVAVQLDVL